ncbi:hypothetical protein QL285_002492 [Trifolium repens]|nr:hypothetical protein QL285_002492 [Trifolium repens]
MAVLRCGCGFYGSFGSVRFSDHKTRLGVVAGFSGGGQRLKMGRLVAVPVLFGCRLVYASLVVKASLLGGCVGDEEMEKLLEAPFGFELWLCPVVLERVRLPFVT